MLVLNVDTLLDYTAWERERWLNLFRAHKDSALSVNLGPHGDGRFEVVGHIVRHVFSAEKRYVDRICGRSLTDTSAIPHLDVDALFRFGRKSREELRKLIATFPDERWSEPLVMEMMGTKIHASPRDIIHHVLLHEIRHWAQIATILRLNGYSVGWHDFLFYATATPEAQSSSSVDSFDSAGDRGSDTH